MGHKNKKAILFGGSNSIMSNALRTGLESKLDILNLAVGASSTFQNFSALIEHKDKIINADFIISESNVNDSHNVSVLDVSPQYYVEIINSFYFELYKYRKPCIVLLLPVKVIRGKTESQEVINIINEAHRECATKYGFMLIDLASYFYELKNEVLNFLMPDPRHVNNAFMYNLGCNISDFFSFFENKKNNNINFFSSDYSVITADELGSNNVFKKNSVFNSSLYPLDFKNKKFFDKKYYGKVLLGISTWCDGDSSIIISNNNEKTIKNFNSLNAFNEFIVPIIIDEYTYIESIEKCCIATEKSVNVRVFDSCVNHVLISSIFLKNTENDNDISKASLVSEASVEELTYLIPNYLPYYQSFKFFFSKVPISNLVNFKFESSKIMKGGESQFYSNFVKDSALFFRDVDSKVSYKLMRLALFINPKNNLAKKWLLNKKNKTDKG